MGFSLLALIFFSSGIFSRASVSFYPDSKCDSTCSRQLLCVYTEHVCYLGAENLINEKKSFQKHWCHLPTMLHVLWFVHANGKFDLEVIWATFVHGHLVELRLFWTVGSWMEHNLENEQDEYMRATRVI